MITDFITPKAQNAYERGYDAYLDGNVKAYVTGSKDFRDGYKEKFDDRLPIRYEYFEREQAWDQHYRDDIEPAMKLHEAKQRLHASVAALVISALTIGVLIGHVVTVAGGIR